MQAIVKVVTYLLQQHYLCALHHNILSIKPQLHSR